MNAVTAPLPTWLTLPSHHEWLDRDFASVMAFNLASILPEGGFAWLGADAVPHGPDDARGRHGRGARHSG